MNRLNIISLIFLLLFSANNHAQQIAEKDSIVVLDPVVVSKSKSHKKKITKIELDGFPAYNGIDRTKKIVSLVPNIPDGKISFVRFYFNCGLPNLFKKKLNINYKDIKLGILIYNVAADGSPGNAISENEITFIVKRQHNGELEIDLKSLNLYYPKIYIGFEVLSETNDSENNLYIRYNEKEDAKTYAVYKDRNQTKWHIYDSYTPQHFKLKLGIEQ